MPIYVVISVPPDDNRHVFGCASRYIHLPTFRGSAPTVLTHTVTGPD